MSDFRIGDEVYIHGFVDEVRRDTVIIKNEGGYFGTVADEIMPYAQTEIKPHRNYEYLSDYWCKCGWHLGKKGSIKYCANCGQKVKWDG